MRHAALSTAILLATHLKVQVFEELSQPAIFFSGVNFFDGNPHMIFLSKYGLLWAIFAPKYHIVHLELSFS